ncbi:unnamed protein product, partial [Meganyctiphanes norvegica]
MQSQRSAAGPSRTLNELRSCDTGGYTVKVNNSRGNNKTRPVSFCEKPVEKNVDDSNSKSRPWRVLRRVTSALRFKVVKNVGEARKGWEVGEGERGYVASERIERKDHGILKNKYSNNIENIEKRYDVSGDERKMIDMKRELIKDIKKVGENKRREGQPYKDDKRRLLDEYEAGSENLKEK